MFRVIALFILLGLFLCRAETTVDAQEFRSWQDNSGAFSIEAALLEKAGENVVCSRVMVARSRCLSGD